MEKFVISVKTSNGDCIVTVNAYHLASATKMISEKYNFTGVELLETKMIDDIEASQGEKLLES